MRYFCIPLISSSFTSSPRQPASDMGSLSARKLSYSCHCSQYCLPIKLYITRRIVNPNMTQGCPKRQPCLPWDKYSSFVRQPVSYK